MTIKDSVLDLMVKTGEEMTRERYLQLACLNEEDVEAELESMIPAVFQNWDRFT